MLASCHFDSTVQWNVFCHSVLVLSCHCFVDQALFHSAKVVHATLQQYIMSRDAGFLVGEVKCEVDGMQICNVMVSKKAH